MRQLFRPYLDRVPEVATVLSRESRDGVVITRARFRNVQGNAAGQEEPCETYAVLVRPQHAAAQRRPAILVCHGGGGAAQEEKVVGWAKLGFVALSSDLPGHMGVDDPTAVRSVTRFKDLGYGPKQLTLRPGVRACPAFDTIVAGLAGFNLLAAQDDVDQHRIGVTGISWGGFTSLVLAGLLRERVQAVFSLYGAGYFTLSASGIGNELAKLTPEDRDSWMSTFDPAACAKSICATTLLYPAANDTYFLPPSVMATYQALGGAKHICFGPNQSHWINLPGGTQSWTGETYTEMEPAYFLHTLNDETPALPKLWTDSKSQHLAGFAVDALPNDARLWAFYSTDLRKPWPKRTWKRVGVKRQADGSYRPAIPEKVRACYWYGGVDFVLTAGSIRRPISLTTGICRYHPRRVHRRIGRRVSAENPV
jgi:cephalosporin-C deacetylase-like acetyl esterase